MSGGPDEFYRITFRKKIHDAGEMLQRDLDKRRRESREQRPHYGRYCYGKTPMQTFRDSLSLAKAKRLQDRNQPLEP